MKKQDNKTQKALDTLGDYFYRFSIFGLVMFGFYKGFEFIKCLLKGIKALLTRRHDDMKDYCDYFNSKF